LIVFYFSFFVCIAINLNAQSVIVIDSISALPVENVYIVNYDSSISSVSDRYGKVELSQFSLTDKLIFSHLSYSKKYTSVQEIVKTKIIYLLPANIKGSEVLITANLENRYNQTFTEEIKLTPEIKDIFLNAGDLLKNKTSLMIRDYGGFGGVKTASARGLTSENTVVLFNEARINDLRTGMVDLSAIGTSGINKLYFQKNAGDDVYYPSAGGVLKIYTGKEQVEENINAGIKYSSDKYRSVSLNYNGGNEELFYSIGIERAVSSNHFPFIFNGIKLKRENAHFNKTFLSSDVKFKTGGIKLGLSVNYFHLQSGIPGFVVTNNYSSSRAQNFNNSFLTILNSEIILSGQWQYLNVISFNTQNLIINDPDGILVFADSKKDSRLNDFSVQNKLSFSSGVFNSNLVYSITTAGLNNITSFVSANVSPSKITSLSQTIFSGANYTLIQPLNTPIALRLSGGVGLQHVKEKLQRENNSKNVYYRTGISFSHEAIPQIIFKTHYSHEYRVPTFNERYYSNLFNHYDLKREEYNSIDFGFDAEFKLFDGLNLSAVYYKILGKDKIIWIPTRLAIQTPRNISDVESQGIELIATQKLLNNKIELNIIYNYIDAKNKTRLSSSDNGFDKQLIYTPLHKLNAGFTYTDEKYFVSVNASFLSERFYTADNNPLYSLPAYIVLDISGGFNFYLLGIKHRISAVIYNLLDENYFVIQSYPMPLRTYLLNYSMEIK